MLLIYMCLIICRHNMQKLLLIIILLFLLHQTTDEEVTKFKSLNTARGVCAILGWFVIALAPNTDRLSKNLHEGDDDILAGELELDHVSPA